MNVFWVFGLATAVRRSIKVESAEGAQRELFELTGLEKRLKTRRVKCVFVWASSDGAATLERTKTYIYIYLYRQYGRAIFFHTFLSYGRWLEII